MDIRTHIHIYIMYVYIYIYIIYTQHKCGILCTLHNDLWVMVFIHVHYHLFFQKEEQELMFLKGRS